MNCIVTAGPTYEPLDEVRRLINFSTGRLGSELANFLVSRGHNVTLLLGQQATWGGEFYAQEMVNFGTTADLSARLRELAQTPMDAVFHAAAVSDFGFGKIWVKSSDGQLEPVHAGKISSRAGNLLAELVPTFKIISQLRDWYPKAFLVGWKYETDGGQTSVLDAAQEQIKLCRTNACVANGQAYGNGYGIVTSHKPPRHFGDTRKLFEALEELMRQGQNQET